MDGAAPPQTLVEAVHKSIPIDKRPEGAYGGLAAKAAWSREAGCRVTDGDSRRPLIYFKKILYNSQKWSYSLHKWHANACKLITRKAQRSCSYGED